MRLSTRRPSGAGGGRRGAGMPSQRQLKVGEQVRHVLASALAQGEVHDARLEEAGITVLEVRTSPDLRHASVVVSQLGRSGVDDDILRQLDRVSGRLGGHVARGINLKYAPKLHFLVDDTLERVGRIERLLDEGLGPERWKR